MYACLASQNKSFRQLATIPGQAGHVLGLACLSVTLCVVELEDREAFAPNCLFLAPTTQVGLLCSRR
jgi:hypothetical protein